MYERFTDRARKVLQLSNKEAQQLANSFVTAEHILLALLRDKQNTATQILEKLNVNSEAVISASQALLLPEGQSTKVVGRLPFTLLARQVLNASIAEAKDLNYSYVGTEHLLLGLLATQCGAKEILFTFGLTKQNVQKFIFQPDHDDHRQVSNDVTESEQFNDGQVFDLSQEQLNLLAKSKDTTRSQYASFMAIEQGLNKLLFETCQSTGLDLDTQAERVGEVLEFIDSYRSLKERLERE